MADTSATGFGQEVKQINNTSGQSITFHRGNLPSGGGTQGGGSEVISVDKPACAGKLVITDN